MRLHRPELAVPASGQPQLLEPVGLGAEVSGEPVVHPLRALDRPGNKRLPQVEDDGAVPQRAASRRRTSHASRTSSSVVRALPIASRKAKRPSSRVWERKTSPDALTRSSSRSFSSSPSSRRKQTSEKRRGAKTSQPRSSSTQRPKAAASLQGSLIIARRPSRP